jgi:hypothetical protein
MHKFLLGQTVHFTGEAGSHHAAGDYEIVRQLPENTAGELQYRLRKMPDGPERVVREHQILMRGADLAAKIA